MKMTMNCKEFDELADSYLSNELLVETNHNILKHLESCADCRSLMGERRDVKRRLRNAVVGFEASRIDPAQSLRLKNRLRAETDRPLARVWGLKLVFAAAAALLIVALVGFLFLANNDSAVTTANVAPPVNTVVSDEALAVPAVLLETGHDAIDDHKNCALTHNIKERPITLAEAAKKVDIVNAGFDRTVMEAVRERFGNEAVLVKAHYCVINGRYFTHVVISFRKRTFSVLMTKLTDKDAGNSLPAKCGDENGFGTACFSSRGYAIYIVSAEGESDNTLLANTIHDAVNRHIERVRVTA